MIIKALPIVVRRLDGSTRRHRAPTLRCHHKVVQLGTINAIVMMDRARIGGHKHKSILSHEVDIRDEFIKR